jgi:hypothetical protein
MFFAATVLARIEIPIPVGPLLELLALLFFAITALIMLTLHVPWIYAGILTFVLGVYFQKKASDLKVRKEVAKYDEKCEAPADKDIKFTERTSYFTMGIGGVVILLAIVNMFAYLNT